MLSTQLSVNFRDGIGVPVMQGAVKHERLVAKGDEMKIRK